MDKSNPIQEKSYVFAVHVVHFCKKLREERKEYILSKQLFKSGTSIGANVEEALHAPSKKDFASKLSIALKEAHESHYWIRLIRDGGFATQEKVIPLSVKEADEIISLLTSIIKSARKNMQK